MRNGQKHQKNKNKGTPISSLFWRSQRGALGGFLEIETTWSDSYYVGSQVSKNCTALVHKRSWLYSGILKFLGPCSHGKAMNVCYICTSMNAVAQTSGSAQFLMSTGMGPFLKKIIISCTVTLQRRQSHFGTICAGPF